MKNTICLIILLCLSYLGEAQAPQGIPYQSAIRNASGTVLGNQLITIRFSIRDSSLTGNIVYQETHTVTTTAQGLVSLSIGQGIPHIGVFALINWAQHTKFLQVEMDPTGAANYVDLGTQQMMSVPYALYAQYSGSSLPGPQGPVGSNGISISNVQIVSDSLFVYLSNSEIINAGRIISSIPPTIVTHPILSISRTKAVSGGQITGFGNSPIFARGICWSLNPNPTTANQYTIDSSGIGSFSSSMTGLLPTTTYYVRAYATNGSGTSYGNELSFTTDSIPIVGDSYQGGIVAYILNSSDSGYNPLTLHGLIAAPSDQGKVEWGCFPAYLGGTATIIGSGQGNTIAIMNSCPTLGIAARLCDDLVLNGYSDWYMPSQDELSKLYLNRSVIGGFVPSYYYSSSEESPGNAYYLLFSDGSQGATAKFNTNYVRAIRSF